MTLLELYNFIGTVLNEKPNLANVQITNENDEEAIGLDLELPSDKYSKETMRITLRTRDLQDTKWFVKL